MFLVGPPNKNTVLIVTLQFHLFHARSIHLGLVNFFINSFGPKIFSVMCTALKLHFFFFEILTNTQISDFVFNYLFFLIGFSCFSNKSFLEKTKAIRGIALRASQGYQVTYFVLASVKRGIISIWIASDLAAYLWPKCWDG